MTIETNTKLLRLIEELLSNPTDFENRGRGNELLEFYSFGHPLDSLRFLLSHSHVSVRGTAMFVAAELGVGAQALIDTVTVLTDDTDPHIAWDAMESVFLCANDILSDRFIFVVKQLENNSDSMRRLAMRLISKANVLQLRGAKSCCETLGNSALVHEKCLQILVDNESHEVHGVHEMLNSNNQLIRLYGAIVAKRSHRSCPGLLKYAASNTNSDVRMFAKEALEA